MSYPLSMDLQQKTQQSLKQFQRLIMSRQMQQAIHFLQVPVMELSPLVEMELEQNPVLESIEEGTEEHDFDADQMSQEMQEEDIEKEAPIEKELSFDERDFEILRRLDEDFRDHFAESEGFTCKRTAEQDKLQSYLESSISDEPTSFECLMAQAHEAFPDLKELAMAENLIGNFDEQGFLATPLEEISLIQGCSIEDLERVLHIIQTFHPVGIGARHLQESLLIQLAALDKQETLAYQIVENHFDDLLHNRIPAIKKGLHCSTEEIGEMIDQHISKLDLHPGSQLIKKATSYIIPDVKISQEDEKLTIEVNEETVPRLRLNRKYLRMLDDETLNAETRDFIKQKVVSAKWLLRNIVQRNDTLFRITEVLVRIQSDFFLNPEGNLVPLTMKMVADELALHESTIARAVSNKYMDSPKGILPLRFFFTNGLENNQGEEISSNTAREILSEIINGEDKAHPFSDEILSTMLKEKGIKCARRTVTKYRLALNVGSAQQRRKF